MEHKHEKRPIFFIPVCVRRGLLLVSLKSERTAVHVLCELHVLLLPWEGLPGDGAYTEQLGLDPWGWGIFLADL